MPDLSLPTVLPASGLRAAPAPLRVAHVLDAPFAADGANGTAEAVRHLAAAQAAACATVTVFSGVDGAYVCVRPGVPEAQEDPGGPGTAAPRDALAPRCSRTWIADDPIAWGPDLLHFHSVHVPRHVALAIRARRAGIPYCVTVHGGLFPQALRRARAKKLLFRLLVERRFLNHAAFVHAVSPAEVPAIRRYGYHGPVLIAPNGVPPRDPAGMHGEPVRPGTALRAERIFMFIGRLDPCQKGLDVLIDGFARAALPNGRLVLVGPDFRGARRSLEARALRLGVRPRVILAGPAYGDHRERLLAAADVFVHPSRWEGMSLSVLTAAAAGRPCLLTQAADPLGRLERAGAAAVVEPTASAIAEGLRQFAAVRPSVLEAMGRRAREVANAHPSWNTVARRLLHAYRAAVSAATHGWQAEHGHTEIPRR